ncbi:UNKNOWN [Stylonychia lemnae]|uniref:Right handed beta helix domain-containing protein n=1 Tax=Stylonychia lemnae TaxID=5949 RepID=A0A078AJ42_STYLE|nr:UNKNOWN [Stylonychia lemnae]|eukprot:CDW81492.1 UNKNOWN [Stylonychia lemnae]
MYANVFISDSIFFNNQAIERTKGILCGFANMTIHNVEFESSSNIYWQNELQDVKITGSQIYKWDVKRGWSNTYIRGLEIRDSFFINLRSAQGGAIYILESDLGKETTNKNNKKFQIINSTFTNCTSEQGGALMLDNSQSVFIQNSQFIGNNAKVIPEYQIHAVDEASGGAIYYTCNDEILNCILTFDGINLFKDNYAQIKGGAVVWTTLEPIFIKNNLNFINNSAFQYGDNLACFPQKLGSLSENQYLAHMIKLGLKESPDQRLLQFTTDKNIQFHQSVQDQRSGGAIPVSYMALIDQYGQIVGSDFRSKVRISIQTDNLDEKANMYPPILQGSSDFQASGGVAVIKDVIISGTPGSSYNVTFSSDVIDLNKLSNKKEMELIQKANLDFLLDINLRECSVGEQFTSAGKCIECQDNTYSLIKMIEPNTCEICPSEKAICHGGTNIGPLPGYWRKSNTTKRIEKNTLQRLQQRLFKRQ